MITEERFIEILISLKRVIATTGETKEISAYQWKPLISSLNPIELLALLTYLACGNDRPITVANYDFNILTKHYVQPATIESIALILIITQELTNPDFIKHQKRNLEYYKHFSKTPLCQSSIAQKEALMFEIKGLEVTKNTDFISIATSIIMAFLPSKLSDRKKSIITSQLFHDFNIFKNNPFYSIEEAKDYASRYDIYQTYEDVIFDRIKKNKKKGDKITLKYLHILAEIMLLSKGYTLEDFAKLFERVNGDEDLIRLTIYGN